MSQVVIYQAVFISQFPLIAPLNSITGAPSGGSRTPSVVEGDIYTRRRLNTIELQHQRALRAAHAMAALLYCLC